jgi:hypothetical protein
MENKIKSIVKNLKSIKETNEELTGTDFELIQVSLNPVNADVELHFRKLIALKHYAEEFDCTIEFDDVSSKEYIHYYFIHEGVRCIALEKKGENNEHI